MPLGKTSSICKSAAELPGHLVRDVHRHLDVVDVADARRSDRCRPRQTGQAIVGDVQRQCRLAGRLGRRRRELRSHARPALGQVDGGLGVHRPESVVVTDPHPRVVLHPVVRGAGRVGIVRRRVDRGPALGREERECAARRATSDWGSPAASGRRRRKPRPPRPTCQSRRAWCCPKAYSTG